MQKAKNGLGLTVTSKRKISAGNEYNRFFQQPDGKPILLKSNGNTYDTISFMKDWVKKYKYQVADLSQSIFSGKDLGTTCKLIEDWQMKHFAYRLDGLDAERLGAEEIHTPNAQWQKRHIGIDCDDFAIMASCILTNLSIPHYLRKADYGNGWQHVYVVVPKSNYNSTNRDSYYVIDPVLDGLNQEKPYTRKFDQKMEIYGLTGIAIGNPLKITSNDILSVGLGSDLAGIDGLGATQEFKDIAMFNHLAKTFNVINANDNGRGQKLFLNENERYSFLQMLQNVLKNWKNPQRDQILDATKRKHQDLERKGIIRLRTENNESLSGLWDKIKTGVSKTAKKVATGVSKAAVAVKDAVVKYNPVSLALKLAAREAMKHNYKGLATVMVVMNSKQYQDNLSASSKTKVTSGTAKIMKYYTSLGGDQKDLMNAAKEGAGKKPLLGEGDTYKAFFGSTKAWENVKSKGIAGLGIDPVTITATITAGAAAVTAIAKSINDSIKTVSDSKDAVNKVFNPKPVPKAEPKVETKTEPVNQPETTAPEKPKSNTKKWVIGGLVTAGVVTGAALYFRNRENSNKSMGNVGHVVIR